MDGLSQRQRLFVEGVSSGLPAGRAYEAAGYTSTGASADACASRLLGNAKVRAALEAVQATTDQIADRAERQRWLTRIMRDEGQGMRDRLRASELLARMAGDFSEKREVTTATGGGVVFVTHPCVDEATLSSAVAAHGARTTVILPSNGREG